MLRSLLRTGMAALLLHAAQAHAASTVELVDAGAAPREPLRYRFEAGSSARATLDTALQMNISLGGQQVPMSAVPPIRMTMALRVAEVGADGAGRLEFELQQAQASSSDAAAGAQINQLMDGLKGLAGWYTMDPRGRITASGITRTPEGAAPGAGDLFGDFQQSMQQFAAPFPEEPVGAGARWRVQQQMDTGGMQITQTAEYTLRSRSGSSAVLDLRMVDSKLDAAAALPPGATLDAVRMEGGGSTTLDLGGLVPTAVLDLATQVAMSMTAQDQSQSMTIDLTLQQKVAPATAD